MFICPRRISLLCILCVYINVISGQRRSFPYKIFQNSNRRILNGVAALATRPYMVYLRPDPELETTRPNWLCGGVIIDESFILTSAACIEDVKRFYVVSGTYNWVPGNDTSNECVKNGAVRAVWKCVPKSYVFDGKQFDNIRWMMYDLAIVRVEEPFNFRKRVRGCDFIPSKIRYNNFTDNYEKPGTIGSIAGWGSMNRFGNRPNEISNGTMKSNNSPVLLEADVLLINKKKCKSRWPSHHHDIIDQHMICAKSTDSKALGSLCMENDLSCKDIVYEDYNEDEAAEVTKAPDEEVTTEQAEVVPPEGDNTRRSRHANTKDDAAAPSLKNDTKNSRKAGETKYGGFCENDHGGPLIVGRGEEAVVVGIISACLSKPKTHECYGPFLFTSIFKYRHLIACATEKVEGAQHTSSLCRNALRSTKTDLKRVRFDWNTPSKRARSTENQPIKNQSPNDEMPSDDKASQEHTITGKSKQADLSKEVNSDDKIIKSNNRYKRENPLFKGVVEIGDNGIPIVPRSAKLLQDYGTEPRKWRENRIRARLERARNALGLPVTDKVGPTARSTLAVTVNTYPALTYRPESNSNLHDVDAHESDNLGRRKYNGGNANSFLKSEVATWNDFMHKYNVSI